MFLDQRRIVHQTGVYPVRDVGPGRPATWVIVVMLTVRGKTYLRCFLTSVLLVSVAVPFCSSSVWLTELTEVWHEVLLLLAIVMNSVILIQRWRQRKSKCSKSEVGVTPEIYSRVSWNEVMFWNFVGLLLIVLLVQVAITAAVAWGLAVCLRISIPAIWLSVIVAAPVAVRQILDRRNCPVSKWVKPWFSLCLLTAFSELACLLILSFQNTVTPLTFPEHLPRPNDNCLHIASTGGSTSLGWPWHPHYSISRVAEWQLKRQLNPVADSSSAGSRSDDAEPGYRSIAIHNVARAGDDLKLDIEQLYCLPVKPHVLMVCTGHNELYHDVDVRLRASGGAVPAVDRFLRWSPTFCLIDRVLTEHFSSLWRNVQRERRLVDDPYLTDEQKAERLALFTERLRALSQYCRRQNIELIWFIPAASESACPPNRSIIRSRGRSSRDAGAAAAYQNARLHEQQEEWNLAAEIYQSALRGYPDMAEFHFRLGHCLLHMNQPQTASVSFQRALETDAFPVRAQTDHRQAVEQVAREYGNTTIDTTTILRRMTPHGILDETVILDDVHPTLRGVFVLGTEAADVIRQQCLKDLPGIAPAAYGSFRESLIALAVDPAVIEGAYERLAGALLNRACLRFEHSHWDSLADRLRTAAMELRDRESLPESTPIESLQDFHPGR